MRNNKLPLMIAYHILQDVYCVLNKELKLVKKNQSLYADIVVFDDYLTTLITSLKKYDTIYFYHCVSFDDYPVFQVVVMNIIKIFDKYFNDVGNALFDALIKVLCELRKDYNK